MKRLIEILIVVVVLFLLVAVVGCKKKPNFIFENTTFIGESDPNMAIRILDDEGITIIGCTFEGEPDPNATIKF